MYVFNGQFPHFRGVGGGGDIILLIMCFQFDLVSDNKWKISFSSTVYLLGVLFSGLSSGLMSDRSVNSHLLCYNNYKNTRCSSAHCKSCKDILQYEI